MINGLILLNLSPNLDLTSNNHFTGAFLSFLSVALELKVGKGLHQERLFPEGTALSFELSSKLALLSRHTWLSLLDVFFFLCCDKQRKGRIFCNRVLLLHLCTAISPENPLGCYSLLGGPKLLECTDFHCTHPLLLFSVMRTVWPQIRGVFFPYGKERQNVELVTWFCNWSCEQHSISCILVSWLPNEWLSNDCGIVL